MLTLHPTSPMLYDILFQQAPAQVISLIEQTYPQPYHHPDVFIPYAIALVQTQQIAALHRLTTAPECYDPSTVPPTKQPAVRWLMALLALETTPYTTVEPTSHENVNLLITELADAYASLPEIVLYALQHFGEHTTTWIARNVSLEAMWRWYKLVAIHVAPLPKLALITLRESYGLQASLVIDPLSLLDTPVEDLSKQTTARVFAWTIASLLTTRRDLAAKLAAKSHVWLDNPYIELSTALRNNTVEALIGWRDRFANRVDLYTYALYVFALSALTKDEAILVAEKQARLHPIRDWMSSRRAV